MRSTLVEQLISHYVGEPVKRATKVIWIFRDGFNGLISHLCRTTKWCVCCQFCNIFSSKLDFIHFKTIIYGYNILMMALSI